MTELDPLAVLDRFRRAQARRGAWEALWREAAAFTLPQRTSAFGGSDGGRRQGERLFDATAGDAAEQLAASLLAELTPPWSQWFGLAPGPELAGEARAEAAPTLAAAAESLYTHLDRSNFAVEMHQCYLDLVLFGTACLQFEEAPLGAPSAFRFTAVPLDEAVVDEGPSGALDVTFRRSEPSAARLLARFGGAALPEAVVQAAQGARGEDDRFALLEAVLPDGVAYDYIALLEAPAGADGPSVLARGRFARSPFITFRWMKAPGEVYGRSPVLRALPDIKTANKVVELTLKNASIAVAGIWQADDDGVLNPATIELKPGTIIPKAVGSSGLSPLQPANDFDVSQIVLADLRQRIRSALLVNTLGAIDAPNRTATEVLERTAEVTRVLGATYGRLQAELLTPLLGRGLAILARRGEVPEIQPDGRTVALQHRSPLAQVQARKDITNTTAWVEKAAALGEAGLATVDLPAVARRLGEVLGVPAELMRPAPADADTAGDGSPAPAASAPAPAPGAPPPAGTGGGDVR